MSYIAHTLNIVSGMYQQPFCKEWDKKLNEMLDKHSDYATITLEGHRLMLGAEMIWIGNKWHSYGHLVGYGEHTEKRPSIRTMRRLDELVQRLKEEERKEEEEAKYKELLGYIK